MDQLWMQELTTKRMVETIYIYINNGLNLLLTGAAFLPSAMFDDTSALRQTAQGSKGASTNGLLEAHDPTNQHVRWMTQVCAPLNGYDMN